MSELDFDVAQESDTVSERKVRRVGIGAAVIGALSLLIAAWLLLAEVGSLRAGGDNVRQEPSRIHIGQVKQTYVLGPAWGLELERREQKALREYKWVDKQQGVAQIPIDRAIHVVVERSR